MQPTERPARDGAGIDPHRPWVRAHDPLAPGGPLNPLCYPLCLSAPGWLPAGSDWYVHIPFALFLVDALRPGLVVELGTRYGDSYCAFCQGVRELRLDSRCFAVAASAPGAALRRHHDALYRSFSTLLEDEPEATLRRFPETTIDLLHLNIGGRYHEIRQTFESWLPRVSARGVVLLHGISRQSEGATRLWEELKAQFPHFELPQEGGLGLLAVSGNYPRELAGLLSDREDTAALLRTFFFQLGHALGARAGLDVRETRLREEVSRLREGLHQQIDGFAGLQEQVADKDRTIEDLCEAVAERDLSIYTAYTKLRDAQEWAYREWQAWRQAYTALEDEYRQLAAPARPGRSVAGGLWRRLFADRLRAGTAGRLLRGAARTWTEEGSLAVLRKAARPFKRLARRVLHLGNPAAAPACAAPVGDILLGWDEPDLRVTPTVAGSVAFRGWSLARSGIEGITVLVDGQPAGAVTRGWVRPEVARTHPDYPDAERCGFCWEWDSRLVPDGPHAVVVRATATDGTGRDLAGTVVVDNKTPRETPYQRWITLTEERDCAEARARAGRLAYRPLVSLLLPVANGDPALLTRTLDSIAAQAYAQWEVCACGDGARPDVRAVLANAARQEPRVRALFTTGGKGAAAACVEALATARGEFVAVVEPGAELSPQSLYHAAARLNDNRSLDLIYGDEDGIDLAGRRHRPFFKPGWSPDLLLAFNYLGRFALVRAELARRAGGFRTEYNGAHEHDLYLRVAEQTDRVAHIARVLYHARLLSAAEDGGATVRAACAEAGHRALADHLARRGIAATVTEENLLGCRRVRYVLHGTPLVSIVLPTGGNVDRLAECVHSILETTAYRDFELILVDHSSGDLVRQFHEKVRQRWPVCQYVDCRAEPANLSALSNRGARYATGEYLLFLNEATAVLDRDWLTALLEQAQRTEVGAVGGKLLHVDDTIQHAGLALGVCGVVGHVFRFFPGMEGDADCHHLPHVVRNCSAVSGACLMIRTALFREVGGFEEIHLPGAYQDVDLCLRLREQGRRIVYTPHVRLYIHEPQGLGQPDPRETRYMQQRWGTALASDPYYNPNLTRRREDHGLDVPC